MFSWKGDEGPSFGKNKKILNTFIVPLKRFCVWRQWWQSTMMGDGSGRDEKIKQETVRPENRFQQYSHMCSIRTTRFQRKCQSNHPEKKKTVHCIVFELRWNFTEANISNLTLDQKERTSDGWRWRSSCQWNWRRCYSGGARKGRKFGKGER